MLSSELNVTALLETKSTERYQKLNMSNVEQKYLVEDDTPGFPGQAVLPPGSWSTLSLVESFIESEVPHLRLSLVKSMMPLKRWVATENVLISKLGPI